MNSKRLRQIVLLASLSPLTISCSDQQQNDEGAQYPTADPLVSYTPPPIPAPSPRPNWDEVEDATYYYIAAVSEEDRAKGRAAGNVLGFRYLGKNGQSEHIVAGVANDGSIATRAYCGEPCKIIRYDNGDRIAYERSSIIGAVFEDAIAGRLEMKPETMKPLVMSPLDESAWNRLGTGCACVFSLPQSRNPMFLAGGDDNLIVRPYGEEAICKLRDGRMQEMFDGGTDLQCGDARIAIEVGNDVRPGQDGYSAPATLTASNRTEEKTWTGEWGCAC